jgi:hypothetical protein
MYGETENNSPASPFKQSVFIQSKEGRGLTDEMSPLLDDPRGGAVESVIIPWGEINNGEEE